MEKKVPVPVVCRTAMVAGKGWSIGVSFTTSAADVLQIVARAIGCSDTSSLSLWATELGGADVELEAEAAVLPHAIEWRKKGSKGRFTVKDRVSETAEETTGRVARTVSSHNTTAPEANAASMRGRVQSMPSIALNDELEQLVREKEASEQAAAAAMIKESAFEGPAKIRIQSQKAPPSPIAQSAVEALAKRRLQERNRSASVGPQAQSTGADRLQSPGQTRVVPRRSDSVGATPEQSAEDAAAAQKMTERERVLLGKKKQIEEMKKKYKEAMRSTTEPGELLQVQERLSKVNTALETVSSELSKIRLAKARVLKRQSSHGGRLSTTNSPRAAIPQRPSSSLATGAAVAEATAVGPTRVLSPRGGAKKMETAPLAIVSSFTPAPGVDLSLPDALGAKILVLWKKWVPDGGDGEGKAVATLFAELLACKAAPANVRQLVVQLLDKLSADNVHLILQTALTPAFVQVLFEERKPEEALASGVLALCGKLLAASPQNKGLFCLAGGVAATLVQLERKADPDIEAVTSMLYGLLQCKTVPAKDAFRASQGLERAVNMLANASPLLTAGLLKLLVVLGLDQEEKQGLVAAGVVLPPLMAVVSGHDLHPVQSVKMAGILVAMLSAVPESRQYIAGNLGAVEYMLRSQDGLLVSNAVRTLGNLALCHEALKAIRKAALVPRLVELMQQRAQKPSLRAMAARCLGNLMLDERILRQVVDTGGAAALLEALGDTDAAGELRSPVLWALVNLSQKSPLSEEIRRDLSARGAVGTLVGLLASPDDCKGGEECLEALKALSNISLSGAGENVDSEAVAGTLLSLADKNLLSNEEEETITTAAVSALVNLSKKNDVFRRALREQGGLDLLTSRFLSSADQQLVQVSCNLVTNLCLDGRCRWQLQKDSGLQERVRKLTTSGGGGVKGAATQALGNLSFPCEDYSDESGDNAAADEQSQAASTGGADLNKSAVLQLIEQAMADQKEQDANEEVIEVLDSSATLLNSTRAVELEREEESDSAVREPSLSFSSPEEGKEAARELEEKMEVWAQTYRHKLNALEATVREAGVALEELVLEAELDALVDSSGGGGDMEKRKEELQARKAAAEKDISALITDHKIMEERAEARRKQIETALRTLAGEGQTKESTAADGGEGQNGEGERGEGESGETVATVRKIDRIPAKDMTREQAAHYHQERMKIAAEMLVSERSYVESLNALVAKYMVPFHAHSLSRKPLFSTRDVDRIFANIEEIVNYHIMFLEGLERRVSKFDRTTCLGKFFSNMTQYLKCYTKYINNYDDASVFLAQLEENPKFKTFLQGLVDSPVPGKNMYNYLIMPIQRIPRYIMLIDQLLKHTKCTHPDYEYLQEGLRQMEEQMRYIDDLKDVYNRNPHLVALERKIEGFPDYESLIGVNRTIVRQAPLLVDDEELCMLLFTDAVVLLVPIAQEKPKEAMSIYGTLRRRKEKEKQPEFEYSFRALLPAANMELFADAHGTVFSLRSPEGALSCDAGTEEERVYWLTAFEQVLAKENFHSG